MQKLTITTFYKFFPLDRANLESLQQKIQSLGEDLQIRGLFLLGTEGINATVSGPALAIDEYKTKIQLLLGQDDLWFKDSYADKHPFHEMKTKIRPEIVTADRPDLVPQKSVHKHLPPDEWDQLLNQEDTIVIDTRNDYEYELGHFKKAINPKIEEFGDFPKFVEKAKIEKDKNVLIYCTGGIRCEKAILQMEEMGYKNVFQLEGGILNYLEKKPHATFEGECFVFDYRVAVDQELNPSKTFRICPHCGCPGKEVIECGQCGREDIVCESCLKKDPQFKTCSKNCAHHYRMGHRTVRRHEDSHKKRSPV